MTRLRSWRLLAAVALLALASAGCAARLAYRQGKEAAADRDWDLAVARYTRALDKDQDNIGYQIALETARVQASRMHYDEAKKQLAANDLDKAVAELEIASRYDPANRSASDDLVIVRQRIETREQEKRERAGLDQLKARAQSTARVPVAVLSPRSPVPITMRFEDGSLQKIFESLGRIAGVNVLFDEGFRDKKASVNLTGVTFEEALDRLTFVNRLFYKVVDQNTLIIVPESRQKRVAYDELLLRTFYVQNAEINDTVNLVKTLAKVTTVGPNPSLGAITVLGTLDQLAMAERIIEANDKARGEVVVEVQILELNRTKVREWGIDISNYSAAATLSPTGATDEVVGGLLNIRAYLLSSLNQADWVVTLPSTILAKFTESNNLARVLASPRLRAAEGKKAELKIGEEVPIPVTTFGAGTSAGSLGSYIPATSFTVQERGGEPEHDSPGGGERGHHAGVRRRVQHHRRQPERRKRERPALRADLPDPQRHRGVAPARRRGGADRRSGPVERDGGRRRRARGREHPHSRQAVRHPQEAVQGLRGRHLHDAARRPRAQAGRERLPVAERGHAGGAEGAGRSPGPLRQGARGAAGWPDARSGPADGDLRPRSRRRHRPSPPEAIAGSARRRAAPRRRPTRARPRLSSARRRWRCASASRAAWPSCWSARRTCSRSR